jgi:hypothetical protein
MKHICPITSIDEGTVNDVRERSAISCELSSVAGMLSGTEDEDLGIPRINGLPTRVHPFLLRLAQNQEIKG